MIRVAIVDDEPLARRGLVLRLQDDPEVCIVGEAANGRDSLVLVMNSRPDVVLLDIQMPGLGGIEAAAQIEKELGPYIIFVTAFDRYALQAFEVHARDYLLKPIDTDRLFEAIARAKKFFDLRDRAANSVGAVTGTSYPGTRGRCISTFKVHSHNGTLLLRADAVQWIEADGDYACLHLDKQTYMVRATIRSLERLLDHVRYVRIHRRVIVRVDCVERLKCLSNRDAQVVLKDGTELRVS